MRSRLEFVDDRTSAEVERTGAILPPAAGSRLPDYPDDATSSKESLQAMVERYAALAASTRAAIDSTASLGDIDTSDLFTEVSRDIDKSLWFLEAHRQDRE